MTFGIVLIYANSNFKSIFFFYLVSFLLVPSLEYVSLACLQQQHALPCMDPAD